MNITPPRSYQRGAAALEFALALPILLLLLWGLLGFGALFYTQMAVARAAHDGARAAAMLPPQQANAETLVRASVIEALAATPIAPVAHNGSYASRRAWLSAQLAEQIEVEEAACGAQVCTLVRVRYPYGNGVRLLPTIRLPVVGALDFLPDTLVGEAVVVRRS